MCKERCELVRDTLCKLCDVIFNLTISQLHNFERFYLPDTIWERFFWLSYIYLQTWLSYVTYSDDNQLCLGFCDFLVEVTFILIF